MEDKGITVYCASADNIDPAYTRAAYRLGGAIARAGLPVINGGGRMGLMRAVTDGALDAGGRAIGIIPGFMVEQGRQHPGLSELVVTPDMAERKRLLASRAKGIIALPGGVGTFEELFEAMTNLKLGLLHTTIVILNINHYYDPLIDMLVSAEEGGFSYGPRLWHVADTVDRALSLII